MKRKLLLVISTLLIVCCLTACSDNKRFNEITGLNIDKLKLVDEYDSHGGFQGDGISYFKYDVKEDNILADIEKDGRYHKFPLEKAALEMLYDNPYIVDENQKALMPEVNNGYYLIIDRHSDAHEGQDNMEIFERYSLNYTIVVYDSDNQYLYICEQDT